VRRPRDNVVVHRSDPAPRIRSPAVDRRIRSPDGTYEIRGPTIRNLAAFPAKAGRFPPGEAGSNERGELQSIVPIASPAPLRRESRRRALKRHGPDPGPPLSRPDELPASGGMRAAGLLGAKPPPGGGRGGDLQPRWAIRRSLDCLSNASLDFRRYLGPSGPWTARSWPPPRGVGGGVSELRTRPCARDSPRSAVGRRLDDGRRGTQARSSSLVSGTGAGRTFKYLNFRPGSGRNREDPGQSGSDPDNSAVSLK
jgi:hypothetical protein